MDSADNALGVVASVMVVCCNPQGVIERAQHGGQQNRYVACAVINVETPTIRDIITCEVADNGTVGQRVGSEADVLGNHLLGDYRSTH